MPAKRLLFVCVENSNRSQMAEGFARMLGGDRVEAYSAGSKPSGKVNPKAIAAMAEVGYDLSSHTSKSLEEIPAGAYAAAITMGCGDSCPNVAAQIKEDWQLPDPRDLPPEDFHQIRDAIEARVRSADAHLTGRSTLIGVLEMVEFTKIPGVEGVAHIPWERCC